MDDDLAYDGSNAPPTRDLTARERDILCRVIRDFIGNTGRVRMFDQDRFVLAEIARVIDPRRELNDR